MLKTDNNPHGVPQPMFDQMAAGMREDRPHFFANFFKQFYGVGALSHPVSDELLAQSTNVAMQSGLWPTLACANAFATTDFRPDLAAFRVPTLIIHGTADKTVPIDATARESVRGIAGAKLIEYDGAPHGLFATHKQRLTDDLLAFLNS
ncbi:MAG: alpha/beta hydrolase [Roseiflexaceae bacterium]|nr:alpha/beta hydrolase [Roseiflexaceae bacterium]